LIGIVAGLYVAAGMSELRRLKLHETYWSQYTHLSTKIRIGKEGSPQLSLPWIPEDSGSTYPGPQARIDHRIVIEGSSTSISMLSPVNTI